MSHPMAKCAVSAGHKIDPERLTKIISKSAEFGAVGPLLSIIESRHTVTTSAKPTTQANLDKDILPSIGLVYDPTGMLDGYQYDNETKHPGLWGPRQKEVRLNATGPDGDPPGSEMKNAGRLIRNIPASACVLGRLQGRGRKLRRRPLEQPQPSQHRSAPLSATGQCEKLQRARSLAFTNLRERKSLEFAR